MGTAEKEKQSVALSSVLAAVFLTGLKLAVGVASGSLGILAEAAHSGLDLGAALITYFAVRISGKPADRNHLYGHGKVENLSALFETILLLVTCIWIIHEAYDRLMVKPVKVEASIWAFAVMAISIVVDISRSRMLYRAAHKHNSQALEADALHFRTDIWSSAVVIFGLFGVKMAEWFPALDFFQRADALAALGVAMIVVHVSVKLGMRTIEGLLDVAPAGMAEKIRSLVESMNDVKDCHAVRVRPSGPHLFIDVHVSLDEKMPLKQVHELMDQVEEIVMKAIPNADVTVHPEPSDDRPQTGASTENQRGLNETKAQSGSTPGTESP
ncbi:MAG TPA: cation diffusion facilitator family transporter [Candidatus Paceibacterota bacterium]|nr:cation diffusion facilitator family transporter [Verrucomicrobiota bacterium]HRY52070.1 cation diffusion facilitator family transporter [Candidatus Paceibacterota bacterium]